MKLYNFYKTQQNRKEKAAFSTRGLAATPSNPTVATGTEEKFGHSQGGMAEDAVTVEYPNKNDRGYDWRTTAGKGGKCIALGSLNC